MKTTCVCVSHQVPGSASELLKENINMTYLSDRFSNPLPITGCESLAYRLSAVFFCLIFPLELKWELLYIPQNQECFQNQKADIICHFCNPLSMPLNVSHNYFPWKLHSSMRSSAHEGLLFTLSSLKSCNQKRWGGLQSCSYNHYYLTEDSSG